MRFKSEERPEECLDSSSSSTLTPVLNYWPNSISLNEAFSVQIIPQCAASAFLSSVFEYNPHRGVV